MVFLMKSTTQVGFSRVLHEYFEKHNKNCGVNHISKTWDGFKFIPTILSKNEEWRCYSDI